MRIASLLPSTTEIACKLGFEEQLVGRSHECDFPKGVSKLPVLTRPKYKQNGNSLEIDQRVKSLLQNGLSVYEVDAETLSELKPDVILTQDHCEVCAVSLSEVKKALQSYTGYKSEVVSVSPVNLEEIFRSFSKIGRALNAQSRADSLINETRERLEIIRNTALGEERKSVVTIEWIDPLMTAGNWMPELIDIAGGQDLLGKPDRHSPWINWDDILNTDPDFLLILPCGYSLEQTANELDVLTGKPGWDELRAVKKNHVFVLEGNQFFNRPGPRILESARILGEILHPALFKSTLKNRGWVNMHELAGSIR